MMIKIVFSILLVSTFCLAQTTQPTTQPGDTIIPLTITGGHDTDPQDGGRPVILVASALGVPAEVFRDVFKNVHPAERNGGPTGDEARANKKVLLDGLSKYGVTNDRLDEVSTRYRYRPQNGELWTNKPAMGTAIVRGGKVIGVTISDPGFGYSSPPMISVAGHADAKFGVVLMFGQDFKTNGSIQSAKLVN